MCTVITFLERAAQLDLWDLLTFAVGLLGAITALFVLRRRRYVGFSLYPSYRIGTGHSLYPNVLHFTARNLLDSPIVVCRPNFRASKHLRVADSAHGNLDTGDLELKFRELDSSNKVKPGHSYTTIMLRHRESAMAYLPIDKDYTYESFDQIRGKKHLGWITFDIVVLGAGRPKVIHVKQKVKKIAVESHVHELGFDPARAGAAAPSVK